MSLKFFSGLQDLLGLYDGAAPTASGQPSTSTATTGGGTSPSGSSPVASPTQGGAAGLVASIFSQGGGSSTVRKRSLQSINNAMQSEEYSKPVRRCSHSRVVHFPQDGVVTGFHDAPRSPFAHKQDEESPVIPEEPAVDPLEALKTSLIEEASGAPVIDPQEILNGYRAACARSGIRPSQNVERQISSFHSVPGVRQDSLSLKGERVGHAHMEALEEIFRRVQFDNLDLEYTFLDDDTAIALAEMLEFYETALKLNLSFNQLVSVRGWSAVFRAVKNCTQLQLLNLRYTNLTDKALPALCRTLRAQSSLTCLHVENAGLSGKNLLLLVCALKQSQSLRELYLGENSMQPTDGAHIFQLITSNTSIQMLDLRNNQLADGGVRHVCDALRNSETLRKSALSAIVLWSNRVTHASMDTLATAVTENQRIETLNIGNNSLGTAGVQGLKPAILHGRLHRLGLQATNLDCQAAIILAECLAENSTLMRLDLRDNIKMGSAGLLALHSAMRLNTTLTNINLDEAIVNVSSSKEEFHKYFAEIREFCERNRKEALARIAVGEAGDEERRRLREFADVDSREQSPQGDKRNGEVPVHVELAEQDEAEEAAKKAEAEAEKAKAVTASPTQTRRNAFHRSSSLTCTETVADINERIEAMSGSTHSLDEASDPESTRTIKKPAPPTSIPLLHKTEWGSLPSLPTAAAAEEAKPKLTSQPVVRKMRRFSVSPSTSQIDVTTKFNVQPTRPETLPLPVAVKPKTETTPLSSSLPETKKDWDVSEAKNTPSTSSPTSAKSQDEMEAETERIKGVRAVVCDLINYIIYEEQSESERKKSILLGLTGLPSMSPRPSSLLLLPPTPEVPASSASPSPLEANTVTPSRFSALLAEDGDDGGDVVEVSTVVRSIVREVIAREKEARKSELDRRRAKLEKKVERKNAVAGLESPQETPSESESPITSSEESSEMATPAEVPLIDFDLVSETIREEEEPKETEPMEVEDVEEEDLFLDVQEDTVITDSPSPKEDEEASDEAETSELQGEDIPSPSDEVRSEEEFGTPREESKAIEVAETSLKRELHSPSGSLEKSAKYIVIEKVNADASLTTFERRRRSPRTSTTSESEEEKHDQNENLAAAAVVEGSPDLEGDATLV